MEDKIRKFDPITSVHKNLPAYFVDNANVDTDIPVVEHKQIINILGENTLGPFCPPTARKAITTNIELLLSIQKKGRSIPAFLEAGPRAQLRYDPQSIRAAIVVSGGLVPGLHSLINSIVTRHYRYSSKGRRQIFGVYDGFKGLCDIADNIVALDPEITGELLHTGGSMLGVENYHSDKEKGGETALSDLVEVITTNLENYRIDILYIIGGNESLKVAHKIALVNPSRSIVGIPATTDDDIRWVEKPVGFNTIVEQIPHVINTLRIASESTRQICLIELPGADSSLVAAKAALACVHVDLVIIPDSFRELNAYEARKYLKQAIEHIREIVKRRTHNPYAVVIVAEGMKKVLERIGGSIDEVIAPDESFINQFGRILKKQVFDARGHTMSVFVSQPRNNILAVPANAHDHIYCERLGALAVDNALAGYKDFMISQWLTEYVLVPLRLVVEDTVRDPAQKDYPLAETRVDAELVDSETLRIKIPLPALLTVDDLTQSIVDKLNAVEILYSVFAILTSECTEAIESFLYRLRKPDALAKVHASSLHQFLATANKEPLRVIAIHYGSPASLDLLGIGKVLEVVRDIIKDAVWHGKHEKELAELERKAKQAEIVTTRLDHEKTSVEIAAQRMQLEKVRLENYKRQLEIAAQKLEIIKKARDLSLTDDDKKLILAVVTSQIAAISDNPVTGSLKG